MCPLTFHSNVYLISQVISALLTAIFFIMIIIIVSTVLSGSVKVVIWGEEEFHYESD